MIQPRLLQKIDPPGLGYRAQEEGWATASHTYPLGSGAVPVKTSTLNHTLSRAFDLSVLLLALTVRHFCPTDYNSLWAIIQLPSPGPAAVSPNIISFMHILSVSLLSGIISELNFSPAILASGAARFMG